METATSFDLIDISKNKIDSIFTVNEINSAEVSSITFLSSSGDLYGLTVTGVVGNKTHTWTSNSEQQINYDDSYYIKVYSIVPMQIQLIAKFMEKSS